MDVQGCAEPYKGADRVREAGDGAESFRDSRPYRSTRRRSTRRRSTRRRGRTDLQAEVQQEEAENKDDKKSAGEDPDKSLPVLPLALIGGVLATGALLTIFLIRRK